VGQVVKAVSAKYEKKQTTPPDRYTQDTLLEDMLNVHKFARDDQEKAVLKETEGLGTSRTREPTIRNLIERAFLESKKKGKVFQLISTPLARQTIAALPATLTSPATTAKWEMALGMVEQGKAKADAVIDLQINNVRAIVEEAKGKTLKVSLPFAGQGAGGGGGKKAARAA
jgi:DNA topoisomerase-3